MRGGRVAHRFGGVWTEIKLRALTEYLHFYQNALKNMGFETWYVDAFAGTGDRHAELTEGGILEGTPIEHVERILDGSARKALKIRPPFSHYVFVERHRGRAAVLESLRAQFASDIAVLPDEANEALRNLFASPPWSGGSTASRQRGVVFLDPYGMSVEWATLEALSKHKLDVWYLFPRKAVIQQLARDIRGVDGGKRRKLREIFGTNEWEQRLYNARLTQPGLFDQPPEPTKDRVAGPAQISAFARERLATIFLYVSEPLPLIVNGSEFFELYCLSNNGPAVPLIKKGVEHVRRKYTPASHRRSCP